MITFLLLILATAAPPAFDPAWVEPHFGQGPWQAPAERFRARQWAEAAEGFAAALRSSGKTGTVTALRARLLMGLARENLRQWRAGEVIFEALFRDDPLLAPYHAYHAGRCHLRRGDAAGALAWVQRVPARVGPDAEARLVALDALRALGRWRELEAEAGRYLADFPAGPRRAEARFAHTQALERLGRWAEAAAGYRRIWAEAPLSPWGARAEQRLAALVLPARDRGAAEKTAADWVTRAMVLFEHNQNQAAERACEAALAARELSPALACQARYHRAASVWKQRQRTRAIPLFSEAESSCRAARDLDLTVKSIYQRGRSLVTIDDPTAAVTVFEGLAREFPDHSYADDAHLRAALALLEAGDESAAAERLAALPGRFPRGDMVGEALWRLAFRAYRAGDLAGTHRWLEENLRRVPRASVWYAEGRAEYWQGRTFAREGNARQAEEWYERAVRGYPLSVYAWLALHRLGEARPARRARLVEELRQGLSGRPAVPVLAARALFGEPGFRRAVELARSGLVEDAHRELARLRPSDGEPGTGDELAWITAAILGRAGLWSASYAITRYKVPEYRQAYPGRDSAWKWQLAYPQAFPRLVGLHCAANGVPQALQLAIMREESGFDPRAESTANCLGLTMLKPDTAAELLGRKVGRETLLDPETNIGLGSRRLASLVKHFASIPLAVAAYNAGAGAAGRWRRELADTELDELLELIPYEETRGYTKRVLATYFVYSWLYVPENPVPPVPGLAPGSRP